LQQSIFKCVGFLKDVVNHSSVSTQHK